MELQIKPTNLIKDTVNNFSQLKNEESLIVDSLNIKIKSFDKLNKNDFDTKSTDDPEVFIDLVQSSDTEAEVGFKQINKKAAKNK